MNIFSLQLRGANSPSRKQPALLGFHSGKADRPGAAWRVFSPAFLRVALGFLLLAAGLPGLGAQAGSEPGSTKPITSAETLIRSKNPRQFEGRRVELSGLTVRRVVNFQVLIVGPRSGGNLVLRAQHSTANLKAGETIDVTGVVNQMPVQRQGWALGAEADRQVKSYPIFINSIHLHPHQKGS